MSSIKPDTFYPLKCEVEIIPKNHLGFLSCCRSTNECHCGEKVARLITDSKNEHVEEENQDKLFNEIAQIALRHCYAPSALGGMGMDTVDFVEEAEKKFTITRKK